MRAPTRTSTRPSLHPTQRKVVRFPSDRSLNNVLEIETLDKDEAKCCWYQPADYKHIRDDIDATVLELMQIEEDMRYWDTSKYTLRGIEHRFSPRYRDQRRSVQKTTVQMVLRAQKECRRRGIDSHRRIQRVSRMCSEESRARALEVGGLDQFAAGLGKPPHPPSSAPSSMSALSPEPMYKAPSPASRTRRPSLIAQQA